MGMTVQTLIAKLKKFPPRAKVGFQDHDQSETELSGMISYVEEAHPDLQKSHGVKVALR